MATRRTFEHYPNLVSMFFRRAAEEGSKPFLTGKRQGDWVSISWTETARQVAAFADGLRLQYLKKLEECKRQVRINGFIQNAYRMI